MAAFMLPKRLGKELQKMHKELPPGISIVKADDFRQWHLDIEVLDANPLYMNQTFRLAFIFPENYPISTTHPPPLLSSSMLTF